MKDREIRDRFEQIEKRFENYAPKIQVDLIDLLIEPIRKKILEHDKRMNDPEEPAPEPKCSCVPVKGHYDDCSGDGNCCCPIIDALHKDFNNRHCPVHGNTHLFGTGIPESLKRILDPASPLWCTCGPKYDPVFQDPANDCPIHWVNCHLCGAKIPRLNTHCCEHKEQFLHVQVARIIKWSRPDKLTIEWAMGALEEYCKTNSAFPEIRYYAHEPIENRYWSWDVRLELLDNKVEISDMRSLPKAICLAIVKHKEQSK